MERNSKKLNYIKPNFEWIQMSSLKRNIELGDIVRDPSSRNKEMNGLVYADVYENKTRKIYIGWENGSVHEVKENSFNNYIVYEKKENI